MGIQAKKAMNKKVKRPESESINEYLNEFDNPRPKEIKTLTPKLAGEIKEITRLGKISRYFHLSRLESRFKRILVHNVVRKYTEEKYRQYIRRSNINNILLGMKAAMIVNSDMLQTVVNKTLANMKGDSNDMLYPIRFHLFHKKGFNAEKALELSPEERVKVIGSGISRLKNDLEKYMNEVLPLIKREENINKDKLTAVYNDILSKLADIEEYKKFLQVEACLNAKPLTDIGLNIANAIFDIKASAQLPTIILLDFREYCKTNRYNEALKVVTKALINVGEVF